MPNIVRGLAYAFLIIVGALMFTPDGVVCIACGPTLTKVLGVVAIVLGIAGFVVGRGAAVR
ncbi:MAG: hypothetical protein ACRD2T_08815 [Thermoanaerobaculia bacterium]